MKNMCVVVAMMFASACATSTTNRTPEFNDLLEKNDNLLEKNDKLQKQLDVLQKKINAQSQQSKSDTKPVPNPVAYAPMLPHTMPPPRVSDETEGWRTQLPPGCPGGPRTVQFRGENEFLHWRIWVDDSKRPVIIGQPEEGGSFPDLPPGLQVSICLDRKGPHNYLAIGYIYVNGIPSEEKRLALSGLDLGNDPRPWGYHVIHLDK